MGVLKNNKTIIKLVSITLYKVYNYTKKKLSVSPVSLLPIDPLPRLSLISIQNFFNLAQLSSYSVIGVLSTFMLKQLIEDFFHSPTQTVEFKPEDKDTNNVPLIPLFSKELPKKRVLSLHLCSRFYIGQYVIFKQKNKNNVSSVHINKGEIGKIIKRLDIWDFALVDFSIKIPDNFKNWNTKLIADTAFNEAIVIVESIKTKK